MVVKLDTQKIFGGRYFTNTYLLDEADPGDVTQAQVWGVMEQEATFHSNGVQFVSGRVSDVTPNTDNFYVYPVSYPGSISASGLYLPGFMTARVDISVGAGRPLRKYYRTYVTENEQVSSNWSSTYLELIGDAMAAILLLIPTWCDPQGNHAIYASPKAPIQMRQLRRGTTKVLNPIIPIA